MKNRPVFLTISEQIADKIRREIIFGQLKEGTSLKEIELSNEFNVSRGPVRDALKLLATEGFLNITPNVGVKIAPRPNNDSLQLIINLRKNIEYFVIDNCIDSFGKTDYNQLNYILKKLKLACETNNLSEIVDLDIHFHRYIIEMYDDKHIHELWQSIVNRTLFDYGRLNKIMDSYYEHQMILESLKEHNKEKVKELLNQNIQ